MTSLLGKWQEGERSLAEKKIEGIFGSYLTPKIWQGGDTRQGRRFLCHRPV